MMPVQVKDINYVIESLTCMKIFRIIIITKKFIILTTDLVLK